MSHRTILPALKQLGIQPHELTYILTTHCDVDHQGGNAGLAQVAPQVHLLCGAGDLTEVESPAAIMERRYNAYRRNHDIGYDASTSAWLRTELGEPCKVTRALKGGEILRLERDRELEILHLPGHSRGHLGVWDKKNQILFGGDSIQGDTYDDLQGKPALCPTYMHIQEYRNTLHRVEEMPLQTYVGCHWTVCHGRGPIKRFCAASREFAERAEHLILRHLRENRRGATLRELCAGLGPQLGRWPETVNQELCYAFAGHLEDLASRQLIMSEPGIPTIFYAK